MLEQSAHQSGSQAHAQDGRLLWYPAKVSSSFYSVTCILDLKLLQNVAATNDLKSQILTNHSNHMSPEENAEL